MDAMGQQNYAIISAKTSEIDPAKILSPEQIAGIESSAQTFEEGVELYAGAIRGEFGAILSEDTIYALAAKAYANSTL